MHPFPNMQCAGGMVILVATATGTIPAGGSVAAPLSSLGAVAGDVLIAAVKQGINNTIGLNTFTGASAIYNSGGGVGWAAYKALTSADIGSPPALSEVTGNSAMPNLQWLLYRNANSCAIRRSTGTGGGAGLLSQSLSGFTPDPAHKAAIVISFADTADTPSITAPAGFVARKTSYPFVADKIGGYAGETLTVTGSTTQGRVSHALELM